MLIATSLTVALLASPVLAAGATPATRSLPLRVVSVSAASDVSPSLVSSALAEAEAIWKSAGFTFVWRRAPREVVPYARVSEAGPSVPSTLRVVVGNERGQPGAYTMALGWIVFDEVQTPEPEIYLSYENAQRLLDASRGSAGMSSNMPRLERETYLGRAMGRALAHEMGHYLLASKAHTRMGLMQAIHSAAEFFGRERNRFLADPAERQLITARLQAESLVATSQSSSAGAGR